jgi:exopolysaccharide biosynthesis polyprenyl glycosylphosphotransferase
VSPTRTAPPSRRTPPVSAPAKGRLRVPSTPPSRPTPPATRELAPAVFTATLVLADAVALAAGMLVTYWLRFLSGAFPVPLGVPEPGFYAGSLAVVIPVGLFVANAAGLYRPHRTAGLLRDAMRAARALALLGVLLASIAFFYRDFSYSRTFLVGYLAVSWAAVVALRAMALGVHRGLRGRGFGVQRVGIVGGGRLADRLAENIRARPGSGLQVVARLDGESWRPGELAAGPGAGRAERVCAFAREHGIERVIVTDPELTHDERLDVVEACHDAGLRCEFVPDLFEVMLGRVRVEELDGIPLVGSRLHPLDRVDRVKKRTLDLVVSASALAVFLPLFALLALAVKLDSPGPVFFRQRRVGRDGREFHILKFRSMPPDAEKTTGPVRANRQDDRPTRLGRVLRRSSLDELPQLWNVLRGEMSLVGPRPERGHFVEEFRRSIPRYLERHGVKSGLTGWAQVNGLRGDTSIEERTRYDIWYVENWSLALDAKILVLTLFRFLFQEEAY